MKNKRASIFTKISLEIFLLSVLFIICILTFAYIADEIVLENETDFDFRVIHFFATHSNPAFVSWMSRITFFGSSQFLFPAYLLLVIYFLFRKNKRYAIATGIIALSSTGTMFLVKQIFKRKRPDSPLGQKLLSYSFPSGHTVSSFIFCTILAYFAWHTIRNKVLRYLLICLLFLTAILIGISRIVLNVHYASDVIAGFCFAVIWVLIALWIIRKMRQSVVQTNAGVKPHS